jgi:hypothetical protein
VKFSDCTLKLGARWFTGREWANGTAERELINEYRRAVEIQEQVEMKKPKRQRRKEHRDKMFLKWFKHSLTKENL